MANVQADQEHWVAQQKLQEDRKAKRLAYERDLIEQINQKKQGP